MAERKELEEHSTDKYNLWGGRFETGNDKLMQMFNQSLSIDKRLWEEDLIVIFEYAFRKAIEINFNAFF